MTQEVVSIKVRQIKSSEKNHSAKKHPYTVYPNILLDDIKYILPLSEARLLDYVIRRVVGFEYTDGFLLSMSDLGMKLRLHQRIVSEAAKALAGRGLIITERRPGKMSLFKLPAYEDLEKAVSRELEKEALEREAKGEKPRKMGVSETDPCMKDAGVEGGVSSDDPCMKDAGDPCMFHSGDPCIKDSGVTEPYLFSDNELREAKETLKETLKERGPDAPHLAPRRDGSDECPPPGWDDRPTPGSEAATSRASSTGKRSKTTRTSAGSRASKARATIVPLSPREELERDLAAAIGESFKQVFTRDGIKGVNWPREMKAVKDIAKRIVESESDHDQAIAFARATVESFYRLCQKVAFHKRRGFFPSSLIAESTWNEVILKVSKAVVSSEGGFDAIQEKFERGEMTQEEYDAAFAREMARA